MEEFQEMIKIYTPKSTSAVLYNLCEPILVASSLGISLQFANCVTMVYVIIDMCAITPMILNTKFEVIQAKLIMTWIKFGIALVSIGLKVYASIAATPNSWILDDA